MNLTRKNTGLGVLCMACTFWSVPALAGIDVSLELINLTREELVVKACDLSSCNYGNIRDVPKGEFAQKIKFSDTAGNYQDNRYKLIVPIFINNIRYPVCKLEYTAETDSDGNTHNEMVTATNFAILYVAPCH